jgi:hypothetical protein
MKCGNMTGAALSVRAKPPQYEDFPKSTHKLYFCRVSKMIGIGGRRHQVLLGGWWYGIIGVDEREKADVIWGRL